MLDWVLRPFGTSHRGNRGHDVGGVRAEGRHPCSSRSMAIEVLFLAWDSPWPAHFGGALRTLGLLTELSAAFEVELLVLVREPLRDDQRAALATLTARVTEIPQRDATFSQQLRIALWGVVTGRPYHCAVVESSLRAHPDVQRRLREYPGVVYASYGHWGTLVRKQRATNWILDQQNADADFWRVYSSQASSLVGKVAARVNWWLARRHFKHIYPSVGRVVSVCEEDRRLTKALAPNARIEVIENGVDCSYYTPDRKVQKGRRRLLFTGSAAPRNLRALRRFVRRIFPLVRHSAPAVELVVGGDFGPGTQAQFTGQRAVRFTGPVDDLRDAFNSSDVFIVPHDQTHGSQVKVAVAMAMGMAIVSTVQGIRGLPLIDGESALIARSDEEFAACVVALLDDASERERLGVAAQQAALSELDWRVLGKRLVKIAHRVAFGAAVR